MSTLNKGLQIDLDDPFCPAFLVCLRHHAELVLDPRTMIPAIEEFIEQHRDCWKDPGDLDEGLMVI